MAIPKRLTAIAKDKAEALVERHLALGTGRWEGAPMLSDFVYGKDYKLTLLRPPCGSWGNWETGPVSL